IGVREKVSLGGWPFDAELPKQRPIFARRDEFFLSGDAPAFEPRSDVVSVEALRNRDPDRGVAVARRDALEHILRRHVVRQEDRSLAELAGGTEQSSVALEDDPLLDGARLVE